MGEVCTTPRLFITLAVLVVIAIGMAIAVGILATEVEGPAPTTPPPYVTPNPEHPCEISLEDLRLFGEGVIHRDVNNVATEITVGHNNTNRLLEVPESVLKVQTIETLQPLYDNYKAPVGEEDEWGDEQDKEVDTFLQALMETSVMQYTETWMKDRCLLNELDLIDHLKKVWFTRYAGSHSSGGALDSSGFEHTFLGQLYDGHVLGFNNWIFYYHEQDLDLVEYEYGDYISHTEIGEGNEKKGEIVKINFKWHDLPMSKGTMFIGTSPELEMALYTVCFTVMPGEHCKLQMMKQKVELLTMDYQKMGVISVAKPILYPYP